MRAPSLALLNTLAALCQATPFELERRGCSNNCARGVIANAHPDRPTKADCSSFVAVTVTPSTVTYTATVTDTERHTATNVVTVSELHLTTKTDVQVAVVTTTVTSTAQPIVVGKRAATSKSIPTYASACSSSAAYVDACSCIGVSAYTVTAAAPSTTVTSHITQTISETVEATVTAPIYSTESTAVSSTITVTVTTILPAAPACSSPTTDIPSACTSGGQYSYTSRPSVYFVESCSVGFTGGVSLTSGTPSYSQYSMKACMDACAATSACVAAAFIAPANYCQYYSVAPTVSGSGIYGVAIAHAVGTCP